MKPGYKMTEVGVYITDNPKRWHEDVLYQKERL